MEVERMEIRTSMMEIVMNSLKIGRKYGHITEEEFAQYKKEAQAMFRDSDEEILALGRELVKIRERGN